MKVYTLEVQEKIWLSVDMANKKEIIIFKWISDCRSWTVLNFFP